MLKTRGTIAAGCLIVERGSSSFLLLNYGSIQLSSIDLQWIKQSDKPTVPLSWLMRYKHKDLETRRNWRIATRNVKTVFYVHLKIANSLFLRSFKNCKETYDEKFLLHKIIFNKIQLFQHLEIAWLLHCQLTTRSNQ